MSATVDYVAFLTSPQWEALRRRALRRYGRRCALCYSAEGLQVHHRTYDRVGGAERPSDLVALCALCHAVFHGWLRLCGRYEPSEYVALVRRVLDTDADRATAYVRVRALVSQFADCVQRDDAVHVIAARLLREPSCEDDSERGAAL